MLIYFTFNHNLNGSVGMTEFDKDRYLGAWYEYANTFEVYEIGGKCVRATYTDEGDVIGVFNEQVNTM